MENLPTPDGWTNFVNGLGVVFLGIVTAISGVFGYKRITGPDNSPSQVAAAMLDTKVAERLTQSFESLARVIERDMVLREECNTLRKEHNRLLEKVIEQTEGSLRDIRELTYQVKRSIEK